MRRPLTITAAAVAAAFTLLAIGFALGPNWLGGDSARADYNTPDPIAGTVDSVDIDVDTAGNTATSVSSVETAIGNLVVGNNHVIDVVVDEIPPFDAPTFTQGITAVALDLLYDNSVISIQALDAYQLLAANGRIPFPQSDPTPDTDGDFRVDEGDFSVSNLEDGEGVLARITFKCEAQGWTELTLADTPGDGVPDILDAQANTYPINSVNGAIIACGMDVPEPPQPPVADPYGFGTDEDVSMPLLLTGSDINECSGQSYTFEIVAQPVNGGVNPTGGAAACAGAGDLSADVTYTPDADFNGSDSFTFRFHDGSDYSNTAMVTADVWPVNDTPTLGPIPDDSFPQGGSLQIDLDNFYSDVETAAADAAMAAITCPAGFNCNVDGVTHVLTLTNPNLGEGDVTVEAIDRGDPDNCGAPSPTCAGFEWATDTFHVASTPFNEPPVLAGIPDVSFPEEGSDNSIDLDDYYSDLETAAADATFETVPPVFAGIQVVIDPVTHILTVSGGPDFDGEGDVTVRATDRGSPDNCGAPGPACAGAESDTDTFHVTVTPVNDAPLCFDVPLLTQEDTQGSAAPDCMDYDDDIAVLTYEIFSPAGVPGAVPSVGPGGNLLYDPAPDYNGGDSFTYRACDDDGACSAAATVNVTVEPVNDPPVCQDVSITTDEDTQGSTDPDCSDVDSIVSHFQIVGQPAHGAASIGSLLYDPDADFFGSDSFTYRGCDGKASCGPPAVVNVTVNVIFDDPPTADDQAVATDVNTPVDIILTGDDPDGCGGGQVFTFEILDQPTDGTVAPLSGDAICGSLSAPVTYTPDAGFEGNDSFTFRFCENVEVCSEPATVEITVEVPPTPTPSPTPSPTPAPTPAPTPTPEPTPEPTATPAPTPTPAPLPATATPAPTPTPLGVTQLPTTGSTPPSDAGSMALVIAIGLLVAALTGGSLLLVRARVRRR